MVNFSVVKINQSGDACAERKKVNRQTNSPQANYENLDALD